MFAATVLLEQKTFLKDQANVSSQILQIQVPDINAVDQHASRRHVVESAQLQAAVIVVSAGSLSLPPDQSLHPAQSSMLTSFRIWPRRNTPFRDAMEFESPGDSTPSFAGTGGCCGE